MATAPVTLDDLRVIFPGETDAELETRIDEVMGHVRRLVRCFDSEAFSEESRSFVRAVILRALRYDRDSQAENQRAKTLNAGPFGLTIDRRAPVPDTLFSAGQEEALRALCKPAPLAQAHSVRLGFPTPGR